MAKTWVKHVAALDLGTNTFKLVICEVGKPFPPVYRAEKGVFLGKGGLKNKTILPEALKRAKKVLIEYSEILKRYNIVQISAVGTEAIRNAENDSDILASLNTEISTSIQKIEGKREAELIWLGVESSGLLSVKTVMIIDIGGASTEVIIATDKQIKWLKSYKIGVSRALELFPISDPPSPINLNSLSQYFSSQMSDLNEVLIKYQPEYMIGTAGSFDSWRKNLEIKCDHSMPYFQIKKHEISNLIRKINNSTSAKRTGIKGIPEIRKETIVPAGVLIQNLLDIYNFKTVYQCSYSLSEGLIREITKKQK